MFAALKTRDYRLLWSGQGISHLGDQFHLIALPWLVLTLTHDPLQLGIVLALAGIPRAVLMLLGGAFADRHSPRTIMLVSDALRFLLVAAIAAAVLTGDVRLWMVYVLALAFGIVSGFFLPAAEAALPRLVEKEHLEGGNALMMGVDQLAGFVGPALAGTLIAVFGGAAVAGAHGASLKGIGIAMAIDAATFAVSAVTLLLMRSLPALGAGADKHPFAAVAEGLRFATSRPAFRWLFGMIAAANLLLSGALTVGIPVLAQTRFTQGAAAYGFILSAYAIGNLAGYIGAGAAPRPSSRVFTVLVVSLFVMFGAVVASLAVITSLWLAVALMAVLGIGNGYIAVIVISSLQRMTPESMLGRVMSLLMLAMIGLVPLSQAAAGAVIRLGPSALFVPAGAALAVVGLWAAVRHRSWSLDLFEAPAPAVSAIEPT
jgi:MFS family permease